MQAGFEPPALTVAIHEERGVLGAIRGCSHFCVSVLAPASMDLMGHFAKGFEPGANAFDGQLIAESSSGVPYLTAAHAYLECKVLGEHQWSDHVIVCGEIVGGSCENLEEVPSTHVRKSGLSY